MKAAFYTLGCKVNQYETQVMQKQFSEQGYQIVAFESEADIYVINSCTVTAMGDKKSRQMIRRLKREHPEALVALTGCFPQAFPEEAASVSEADIIMGARGRKELLRLIEKALLKKERLIQITPHTNDEPFEPMQAEKFSNHTRAFVKIEDGCDRYCSYCVIPRARGRVRSKPLADLQRELEQLAENGYQEIVLVGINLSSYGKEWGKHCLADAVKTACAVSGIERVRLGSLEPELLTEEDFTQMAQESKFCPQFHLSLQSGCDNILKQMNRQYTTNEYEALVKKIRMLFENPSITTDVMVGFPGEEKEDFLQSCKFVSKIEFSKVHVFSYSPRGGTRAAKMPEQVSQEIKDKRNQEMVLAAKAGQERFLAGQIGLIHEVLFESSPEPGTATGYTKNYTRVFVKSNEMLSGEIRKVRVIQAENDHCIAELL